MADVKISELPSAGAITGAELVALVQGGTTKQATVGDLAIGGGSTGLWARPSEWPALPATAANTMHLLAAVFDHDNNRCALRMVTSAGTYSVDWGDGTSSAGVTSNTNAEHTYDYSDGDLTSTSYGYKVAVVTVTADSGNFTTFNPSVAYSTGNTGVPPWLEMQVNGSSLTTLTLNSNALRMCQHIDFVAVGAFTAISFQNMNALRQLDVPAGFFANISGSVGSIFNGCTSLPMVDISSMPAVGSSTGVFQNGNAFKSITVPSGMLNGATTINEFCMNAWELQHVKFEGSNLSAVTSATNWFNLCYALQVVEFPSGGLGSLTGASNTFANCVSLSRIINCAIPVTFSVANCRLSAAALDEIYTALPTVTSQTITVTGNPGVSGDDPTIATVKGWTVTG